MKSIREKKKFIILGSTLIFVLLLVSHTVAQTGGVFTPTGPMNVARTGHTATLLPSGKVLITGGWPGINSAELYDPATRTFVLIGPMNRTRYMHTATLLPNGTVLIAGGQDNSGYQNTGELYDPSTNTFTLTGPMIVPRTQHTASLLPNGKVLLAGGQTEPGTGWGSTSSEIYDPTTGQFTSTGSMKQGRWGHSAVLLPNGKILVAGGAPYLWNWLASVELYDPVAGTWDYTGSMNTPRGAYVPTLNVLINGQVLVAGGNTNNFNPIASVEVYDPTAGAWTYTGSMNTARDHSSSALLRDGKVIIIGGRNNGGQLVSAELYDSSNGTFTLTGSMNVAREGHTATLLANGKVLIAGGSTPNITASAEIYTPPIGELIVQTFESSWGPAPYLWEYKPYSLFDNSLGALNRVDVTIHMIVSDIQVGDNFGFDLRFFTGWNPAYYQFAGGESFNNVSGPFEITRTYTFSTNLQLEPWTNYIYSPEGHYYLLTGTTLATHTVSALTKLTYYYMPASPPPTANAGEDQTVHEGSVVTLDGSGSSDPGGNLPLSYAWSFVSMPAESTAVLSDPTFVNPTFTADKLGDYVIQMVVTNSLGTKSSPANVTISTFNTSPMADAGPDQAITLIGSTVQLDGSTSYDVDGDDFTYQWFMTTKPLGSLATLSDPTLPKPTFTVDVHGDYIISLVVTDEFGAMSSADTVTISFTNIKPVAKAGTSQSVVVGETVNLNGSGSSDANGDPLTYKWSLTTPEGSNSAISSPGSMTTTFVPDLPGNYVVQLIVNDGFVDGDPSMIQVQVVTWKTKTIESVQQVETEVVSIDLSVLKNVNMQNTLINKLNAVIANIEAGNYADALGQLQNDILAKTDGCAKSGAPDKNDWVTDCAAQNKVYPLIMGAIELLRGL